MSEKIYACMLKLYPLRFRERYQSAAIQLFCDRLHAERGFLRRLRLWLDILGDLAISLPQEHRRGEQGVTVATAGHYSTGVPAFQTLETAGPRVGALVHGGVLSLAIFSAISLAITTGGRARPLGARLAGASRFFAPGNSADASTNGSGMSSGILSSGRSEGLWSRLLLFLPTAFSHRQRQPAPLAAGATAPKSGEPFVIGERLQIESSILKETRPVLISTPDGYERETERYPVLYLLDGEAHFRHTAGIVGFLADTGRIPKMLVVAVPNTNRPRDLTPPSKAESDLRFVPINGGADAFLRFLGDELIPYVDKNYRTRPYKILVGHSLGGLFAIHALIKRPKVFNGYIVIDPSLQWNNQTLVPQAGALFEKTTKLDADLYMTASAGGGASLSGVRKLAGMLDEKAPQGFRWTLNLMPEETHASIPHRTIYLGLDTIFEGWHLTNPLELYDKGGLEAVHRHFREGGKRFGYDRKTSPFTISLIVHGLVQAGRLEEAAALLLHDPKAYPPPWNQLDALARAYTRRGDTKRVIRYCTLSLKENPGNEWARKKLTELGVDVGALLPRRPQ